MKRGPRPSLDQVMAMIVQHGPDECWDWSGRLNRQGYAVIGDNHKITRILLGLEYGDSLVARHRCDNPPCVNPGHLEPGTQLENMADMKARGRSPRGEDRPNTHLTEEQVHAIRADPRSSPQIAADYGVSNHCIVLIKRGERWKYLPVTGPVALPTRKRFDTLTERQVDILRRVEQGLMSTEIADDLGISYGTVQTHLCRMTRRLGVSGRRAIVAEAYKRGMLEPPAETRDGAA